MKNKINNYFKDIAYGLEILLILLIIVGLFIGVYNTIKMIPNLIDVNGNVSFNQKYEIFKEFLSYILILVVGVEFILMLATGSIVHIVELIIFVIARKLLIYGSSMLDLLLGSLAIAVIYGSLKYLKPN